jgi:hypothetical protein
LAYNGGTVEVNSADLDLDSGKKLKWGNQAEIVSSGSGSLEINGADVVLDLDKKLKWGSSADFYYDESGTGKMVARAPGTSLVFEGSAAAATDNIELGGRLYYDCICQSRWLRYTSNPTRLEMELAGAKLRLGSASRSWLELRYEDSRYFLYELNLETSDTTPSGSADVGRVRVKQWTVDDTPHCALYVRGETKWFVLDFTQA